MGRRAFHFGKINRYLIVEWQKDKEIDECMGAI